MESSEFEYHCPNPDCGKLYPLDDVVEDQPEWAPYQCKECSWELEPNPAYRLLVPRYVRLAQDASMSWLQENGNHRNPSVFIVNTEGEKTAMVIQLPEVATPEEIRGAMVGTLKKIVTDGAIEFVMAYEGFSRIGHEENDPRRVLVVIYYTPQEERTWWARIHEDNAIGGWNEIKVAAGELYDLWNQAEAYKWN